ncbi:hypothetical protein Micbo1qcDRAFT_175767 [Microdochium bolleyi]|uniref:Uncharacterized protein n=1 Tax=Microdochium bolleyi TaxID=196109 RepID=A0A136J3B8_9PEZI|nr:hypothetical protein Micbo1qcDRAFT_175767 [Microdochium bolleyi]
MSRQIGAMGPGSVWGGMGRCLLTRWAQLARNWRVLVQRRWADSAGPALGAFRGRAQSGIVFSRRAQARPSSKQCWTGSPGHQAWLSSHLSQSQKLPTYFSRQGQSLWLPGEGLAFTPQDH